MSTKKQQPELTESEKQAITATLPEPTRKRTTSLSSMLAAESQETQQLLHDIARLVNIFKAEINEDPAIVVYLIKKVNPEFNTATMETALNVLLASETYLDISGALSALQSIAKSAASELKANIFYTTFSSVLAATFLPGLSWHKIVLYGAYISNKSMI